jgi:hypothetical protein
MRVDQEALATGTKGRPGGDTPDTAAPLAAELESLRTKVAPGLKPLIDALASGKDPGDAWARVIREALDEA